MGLRRKGVERHFIAGPRAVLRQRAPNERAALLEPLARCLLPATPPLNPLPLHRKLSPAVPSGPARWPASLIRGPPGCASPHRRRLLPLDGTHAHPIRAAGRNGSGHFGLPQSSLEDKGPPNPCSATQRTSRRATMQSWRAFLVLGTLLLLAVMANMACAAYRKPPFNGSIFGKRSRGDLNNADIKMEHNRTTFASTASWTRFLTTEKSKPISPSRTEGTSDNLT
ncbi:hypothetical protein MTO96_015237 [Rhipicephalus appendiculatus]